MTRLWLRLYTEVRHKQKVQSLPDRTFKHWINSLCIAKEHNGALPPLAEYAFDLRITERDAAKLLKELEDRKLIDRHGHVYRMHDFDEHQWESDGSRERMRRYRERHNKRNVKRHSDVACDGIIDTDSDTDSDTETPLPPDGGTKVAPITLTEPATLPPGLTDLYDWFCNDPINSYPGEVPANLWQKFGLWVNTPEDAALLRQNLPLWKASPKYAGGYAPRADKFLRDGIYKRAPPAEMRNSTQGLTKMDRAFAEAAEILRKRDAQQA